MKLQQSNRRPIAANKMASGSRRSDFGEEFVERLRKDRFKKAYILVNGLSSEEEEDEELDFDDEDDEMASYAMGPPPQQPPRPSSAHSSRRPPSIAASYSQQQQRVGGSFGFNARDLYFFGVISELTDKLTPERAAKIIARSPPPQEYRTLVSVERIAYLLYFSLYGRYLNVAKFHNVFNREFFKYTSAGDTERNAFLKICRHTLEEYKRRILEQNKRAYKMTQKHLFSDERATPDSRMSDRPSICADESLDRESLESLPKELMFYRAPHMPVRFGPGGRVIFVNPDAAMTLVCIEDTKKFFKDAEAKRYVEMLESFKGPMLVGHTPPQTPLLFIQRQIDRVLQSDVYRANPTSGDANDCLLIWHLLEMLVRQQGKVTGPDLARLLCSSPQYSSFTYQNFLRSNSNSSPRSQSGTLRQNSSESFPDASPQAMDRVTRFLLGGHIEEAIESAINDGLLFDALLAHRLFRNDQRRLEAIEAKLMAHRSAQHPITTLVSVAADLPVPLLNNPTTDDTNGWRAHIAIVLANLQSQTAMNAVYHLGLALAQKEFNSAADFCFLAVNLLTGYNCFQAPVSTEADDQPNYRRHVRLISASLPDDEHNSCTTRFGWSLLDYQATEIYDYALHLANLGQNALSNSQDYNRTRGQYAQLLGELGGFGYAIELYNKSAGESHYPRKTPSPPQQLQQPQQQFIAPNPHSSQPQPSQPSAHQQIQYQQHPPMAHPSSAAAAHAPPPPTLPVHGFPQHQPPSQHHPNQQQHFAPPEMAHLTEQLKRTSIRSASIPSRSPSPPATTAYLPPIPPAHYDHPPPHPQHQFARATESLSDESEEDEENEEEEEIHHHHQHQMPSDFANASLPFVVPTAPFFNPNPPSMAQVSANQPMMPPQQEEMQGVNVDSSDGRRTSFSSSLGQPTAQQQKQEAPANRIPAKESAKDERGGGGTKAGGSSFLGGRISGLISKMKPQGQNQMKLPDDKNPTIVWDPQLGKYVDQEQKDKPEEELPPPPSITAFPPAAQQQKPQENRQQKTSTPTPLQEQQPMSFPQMANIPAIPQIPKSSGSSPRPFQGKARYANAWNS